MWRAALALMLWAGAATAQDSGMDLPEGYPPRLGGASGDLGTKPVVWEFFDFSIGAFDASAWVDQDWNSKEVSLQLMGYAPGSPDDMRFRLWVSGDFGKTFRTGAAEGKVEVSILRGRDTDGPQLSSEGQRVQVVVDSIGPALPNSYLRHVTGHIAARLCPKGWLFTSCQDLTLEFDTDVQMGSVVEVSE